MKTFIFLLIFGRYSAVTSISQEFSSWETCEKARLHIVQTYQRSHAQEVIAQGCFQK